MQGGTFIEYHFSEQYYDLALIGLGKNRIIVRINSLNYHDFATEIFNITKVTLKCIAMKSLIAIPLAAGLLLYMQLATTCCMWHHCCTSSA